MSAFTSTMLAHSLPPSHHPNHDPNQLINLDPAHDPFQSLYDSLANLHLTTSPTNFPPVPAPIPIQNQIQTQEPQQHQQLQSPPHTTSTISSSDPPAAQTVPITPLFPPGDNVIFAHSSFFYRYISSPNPELPTPAQVRAEAAQLGIDITATPGGGDAKLVPFPAQGLLVKYGPDLEFKSNAAGGGGASGVSAAEGKAMMLLRRALPSLVGGDGEVPVPVPEVFGWRRDARTGERFVYVDLPRGEVLEQRWAGMSRMEREAVCVQLKVWVGAWRRLRLDGVGFVGSVDSGPLRDEVFRGCMMAGAPPPGPFPTVAAFHDYFVSMAVTISQSRQAVAGGEQVRYTPHHLFPGDVPVVFTHGALHPRNIIVSAGPNPRVVSILGWEQAGWYPAYWELCKARWECSQHQGLEEWEAKYLPWILDAEVVDTEIRGWHVGALCQYWDYFVGLM